MTSPFRKITSIGSPTKIYDLPSCGVLARITVLHEFYPMVQASNPIRNLLVTPITVMSLLHQGAQPTQKVSIALYTVHHYVKTVDGIALLVAYTTISSTMKVS